MAIEFDPFSNNVDLLLHFDGPNNSTLFRDYSAISKTVTPYGTSKISTTQSKFGGSSGYFDGSGNLEIDSSQGLYLASSASTSAVGTPDFTVEAWVYCNGTDSFALYCLGSSGSGTGSTPANRGGLSIYAVSGNTVSVVAGNLSTDGWGNYLHRVSVTYLPASGWCHLAVTSENNTPHVFINGVESALAFGNGSTSVTSFANLKMYSPRNVNIMSFNKYQGALDGTAGNGSAFYTGYIDELRITKGIARYGRNKAPTSALVSDANTSLLLDFAGANNSTTFTDISGNPKTVTPTGNTKISTTQSKFGGSSGYFDGSGDYLTVNDDASLDFGSGDFTIELWLYLITYPADGDYLCIFQKRWNYNDQMAYICYYYYTNGWVFNFSYDGTSTFSATDIFTPKPPINTWNHLVIQRKGTILEFFLNGVRQNVTYTIGTNTIYDSVQPLIIGAYHNAGVFNGYINGYIDDFRVSKGVARYDSSFNVPTGLYFDPICRPVLQLTMDGADNSTTFLDSSTYNKTVTANGDAKISTAQFKFGSSSAYFDGSGDYLTIPKTTDFDFGSGAFTIEMWCYLIDYNTSGYPRGLWSTGKESGLDYYSTRLHVTDTKKLLAVVSTNGTSASYITDADDFTLNTWHHVALVRYDNTVTLYKDGISVGTPQTISGSIYYSTAYPVCISNLPDYGGMGYNNKWYGYIDEVRITKGVAHYTANFTPPSDSYRTLYNDVLILWGDGVSTAQQIIDSAYNPKTITKVGDVKISRSVNRFGDSSIYFDGTDDYLTIPTSTDFDFGTGDYTMELWVYPTSIGATRTLLSRYTTWSTVVEFYSCITSAGKINYQAGNNVPINLVGSTVLTANQWYHIAFVCYAGTTKIYLNGAEEASTSTTASLSSSSPLGVGYELQGNTAYFIGYMDEIRITKGYARYTGSFTPLQVPYYSENLMMLFVSGDYCNADLTPIIFIRNDLFYNDVVLLLHCDGANDSTTFTDSSVNNATVTPAGNAKISTAQSKFGGSSAYFDGNGDCLSISHDSSKFDPGSTDWTGECWLYCTEYNTSSSSQIMGTYSWNSEGGTNNAGWQIGLAQTTGIIGVGWGNGGSWIEILGTSTACPLNTWVHLALVKSNNTWTLYLNGTSIGTTTYSTPVTYAKTTFRLASGHNSGFGLYYFYYGYIDEVRITKGKARYTTNFTPPIRAFPNEMFFNEDREILLLHCDGSNNSTTFIDSSSYQNVITPVGNAKISTTRSKFGGSSAYFDGSGDWLSIPYSQNFNFGTGDFTIEMWVYLTTVSNWGGLFMLGEWGGTGVCLISGVNGLRGWLNGAGHGNDNGSVTANTWTHVALTRKAGTMYVFRNGTLLTSVAATGNVSSSSTIKIFAGDGTSGVNAQAGYCDEVRVIKGIALYTANFTPQTIPFSANRSTLISTLYYRGTLLSFYDCEESSGALQDLMLNAPLTMNGTPSYEQSSLVSDVWEGKSITLDTADSFSGAFHSLSGMTTFTTHFYIKTSAVSQPIITKTGVFSITLNSSGQIVFSVNTNSITSSQSVNSNTMRQVTTVFDNGYLILFIDGVLELHQLFTETTITDTNTENLVIGGFDGTIDEIAFYSTAMKFFDSLKAYEAATNDVIGGGPHLIDNLVYINPGAPPAEPSYHTLSQLGKAEEFDLQDGGDFYIEGMITIRGQPVSRKVYLCDRHSGRFIRATWSDPDTGMYRFNKIKKEQFFIWCQDYEDQFNPVSSIPVVTPL